MALLTALCLTVSALGPMAGRVSAAGTYEETDTYVLNYSNQDIAGYEDFDARRLYASDHYAGLYVDEDGDGIRESDWNWTCFSVLNMINTGKLSQPGEGTYASIPVYCADAVTDGVGGYAYRRINLEDSGYFSDEMAGRLRAVFLNSFPFVRDMDMIAASVNAWSGEEYADVVSLTESEAISATQAAIWTLTNDVKVYAPYLGTGGYYEESEMVDTSIFRQSASEYTSGNITALYNYLMDLDAVAPMSTVVTDASIGKTSAAFVKAEDGTYTATVTAVVKASVDEGDRLELTAVCGNAASDSVPVNDGENTYTMTISGLADDDGRITVNIDGCQDASDVFLFDPLNGREASQTMLGYDESALPVHGEAAIDPSDRVLNLYKTTAEGTPLENIRFEIYKVCDLESYINGDVVLGTGLDADEAGNLVFSKPTAEDLEKYAVAQNRIATVTTDADGIASYHFGPVDGVYLVKELENTVIESVVEPFFAAVPGGDSDSPVYEVNVCPKNTVISEDVDIEKDVIEIDQDEQTLDVNRVHTWIIQATIPTGLADAQKYEISDTLDHRLDYVGNLVVTVSEKADRAHEDILTLESGTDYTLNVGKQTVTVEERDYEVDCFTVALTQAGMKKAAATAGTQPELRVYFDAVINANAQLAEDIPNQAHIEYTNSVGTDYEDDSDEPYVYTGGLKLHKTDASDVTRKLAGAVFKLARPATEQEIAAGISEVLTVDKEELAVVYVSFYDTEDMSGEKVTEAVTDEMGVAQFRGLAYGEYYLVETQAPEGYNRLTRPVAVTIDDHSHLDDDPATEDVLEGTSVTVRNSSKFELPATGGAGKVIFVIMGSAMISVALVLALTTGKKKKA